MSSLDIKIQDYNYNKEYIKVSKKLSHLLNNNEF